MNVFERKEGEKTLTIEEALSKEVTTYFYNQDLEEHINKEIQAELKPKSSFKYKGVHYLYKNYGVVVTELEYIIPAGKYMIDSFWSEVKAGALVIIREHPSVSKDSRNLFSIRFRAVIVLKDLGSHYKRKPKRFYEEDFSNVIIIK